MGLEMKASSLCEDLGRPLSKLMRLFKIQMQTGVVRMVSTVAKLWLLMLERSYPRVTVQLSGYKI